MYTLCVAPGTLMTYTTAIKVILGAVFVTSLSLCTAFAKLRISVYCGQKVREEQLNTGDGNNSYDSVNIAHLFAPSLFSLIYTLWWDYYEN